jgi:hypothetical protein
LALSGHLITQEEQPLMSPLDEHAGALADPNLDTVHRFPVTAGQQNGRSGWSSRLRSWSTTRSSNSRAASPNSAAARIFSQWPW